MSCNFGSKIKLFWIARLISNQIALRSVQLLLLIFTSKRKHVSPCFNWSNPKKLLIPTKVCIQHYFSTTIKLQPLFYCTDIIRILYKFRSECVVMVIWYLPNLRIGVLMCGFLLYWFEYWISKVNIYSFHHPFLDLFHAALVLALLQMAASRVSLYS